MDRPFVLYREDIASRFVPDPERTLWTWQCLYHWVQSDKLWYQDRLRLYQILLPFIQVAFELGLLQVVGSQTFNSLDDKAIERSMTYSLEAELDAERHKLIILYYESSRNHLYFRVPYRAAEQFLSPVLLLSASRMQNQGYKNRFNGQPIGVEDGLAHPADSLLQGLLGDAYDVSIFPYGLSESTEDEEDYGGGSWTTQGKTYGLVGRAYDHFYNEDYLYG